MKLGPGLLFMPALMWLSVSPGCGADLDGEADEPADEAERPPIDRLTSDDEAGVLDELERWFSEIVPDPKAGSAEATSVTAAAVAPGECARYFGTSGAQSQWAHVDASGKLVYESLTSKGDHIMDFSYAGYHGGGVKLPTVPVRATVSPSGGDDTSAIQHAIDQVAALPPSGGVRGAVRLSAGTFRVSGTLRISKSGVVLRGSGSGANGTLVRVTGTSHRFLEIRGSGRPTLAASPRTRITDAYVAAGTSSFHVADASGFAVGDAVMVGRPVTASWVASLGMDKLVRNGKPQTWLKPGVVQSSERKIRKIEGNEITVDVPLSDSFDGHFVSPPGGSLARYTFATRLSEVGVEHLQVVAPLRTQELQMGLLSIDAVQDAWVNDLVANNFTNGIGVDSAARRVTIQDTDVKHDPNPFFTAAAPADFSINGQQVLVQRSSSTGGNKIWYVVTHASARGPNVVLDFVATGAHSHLSPHQRWATGLLLDRADVDGGIGLGNLGTSGSGHGWTIAWGVIWNCVAGTNVAAPAGATNWAIGCVGGKSAPGGTPGMPGSPPLAQGTYDSHGHPVIPESLYLAQLCQRLGPAAVADIGY